MRADVYRNKGYVRVIFRYFDGEVLALFPDLAADDRHVTCYAHIGQHGAADLFHVLKNSRPATTAERLPLQRELTAAPYHYKLVVRQRYVRTA